MIGVINPSILREVALVQGPNVRWDNVRELEDANHEFLKVGISPLHGSRGDRLVTSEALRAKALDSENATKCASVRR